MDDLISYDPIVDNEEVKQNLAAKLLPIIADKNKVAEILNIDPKAIDIWMERIEFLEKLSSTMEDGKSSVTAKLYQQTLEMINIVHKKYIELSNSLKTKGTNPSPVLLKTLGQQFIDLRKLISHDHKEPAVIEERYQTGLMEEAQLLPEDERLVFMKGVYELTKITKTPVIGNEEKV